MATCAITMICHSLLEASYVFTGTSNRTDHEIKSSAIARRAYAFIQGTGLDIAIQSYGLDYNPEVIREEFNRIFPCKTPPSL